MQANMDAEKNENVVKSRAKPLIFVVMIAIACIFIGFFIGNGKISINFNEKAGTYFILNIDGIKYDVSGKVKVNSSNSFVVLDDVLTDDIGFAKTIDKENKYVNYTFNTDSFTFFENDTKYVYNDIVLNSSHKCEVKGENYYIDILTVFLDMGLDVTKTENGVIVKGFYSNEALGGNDEIAPDNTETEVDSSETEETAPEQESDLTGEVQVDSESGTDTSAQNTETQEENQSTENTVEAQ